MRILLIGASGFIGRALVAALYRDGHAVRATYHKERPALSDTAIDWRHVDFSQMLEPTAWQELVAGVDVVINAVGIFAERTGASFDVMHYLAPAALFEAAVSAGVGRIVQISALGTDEGARSAYHRSKKRADDVLARLDVPWVILRPSLIVGEEGASWRLFQALAGLPIIPVIGDGGQPLQPIVLDDVVRAVRAALVRKEAIGYRVDLVGEDCVTLAEYLRMLARWQGRSRARILRVPYRLAESIAAMIGHVTDLPLNREAVAMLRAAQASDPAVCAARLGFRPAGIRQALASRPATGNERRMASLLFLVPLLRFALGVVWIWTAIAAAFVYPRAPSLALLAGLGLTGGVGVAALYASSLLDFLLGALLLAGWKLRWVGRAQIALVLFYMVALSVVAPQLWADPFGPVSKNLPILVATLIVMRWEG